MLEWFELVKAILVENKDWIEILIGIITFVASGLGVLLGWVLIPANVKNARRYIKNMSQYTKKQIKSEPMFFDEPNSKRYVFYKGMEFVDINNRTISFRNIRRQPYILSGEAGCGKSTFIKYDYLYHLRHKYIKRLGYIYLNAGTLLDYFNDKDKATELYNNLRDTNYKKSFIYIDGIDEIGENRVEQLNELVERLLNLSPKVVLKVSCRTEFFHKYIERNPVFSIINQHVAVARWTSTALRRFVKKFVRKYIKSEKAALTKIARNIDNSTSWEKTVNSPLLMKLYIYILLYGENYAAVDFENKYDFYSKFITVLIYSYGKRMGSPINKTAISKKQDSIAANVFDAFSRGEKKIQISAYIKYTTPVLKNISDHKASFTHETFYEYFVARHYFVKLGEDAINSGVIAVLCHSYSNDYADFISDAFLTCDPQERRKYVKKFCDIYYFTLDAATKRLFRLRNSVAIPGLHFSLKNIDAHEFFIMKYEIIFRLGRLRLTDQSIKSFLDFVYYHDSNTKQADNAEYFVVVLKRGCAISASFIESERIELDYVTHMLDYSNNYNPYYDLANRSHTLLFYGDVSNNSLFSFTDNDTTISCDKAFSKRIERLSLSLPNSISSMDEKTKKKYLFRVFDLATIYTFMVNRKQKLTNDQLKIITNCQVSFSGASNERIDLMTKLKDKILEFNKSLISIF